MILMNKKLLILILCCVCIIFSIIALLIPISVVEEASIFIVDMYLDKYWDIGWHEIYRIFAILGIIILCILIYGIFQLTPHSLERSSSPAKSEIAIWVIAISFGVIFNIGIVGLQWLIPEDQFIFGGSVLDLFWSLIYALGVLILGIIPFIMKKVYKLKNEDIGFTRKNFNISIIFSVFLGFGYGLISTFWHCCYVFTFQDALIRTSLLLFMTFILLIFFIGYSVKLFSKNLPLILIYIICSLSFCFVYLWHNTQNQLVFFFFGLAGCELYRRTNNVIAPIMMAFSGFFFHTILPYRGEFISTYIIIPLSIMVIILSFLYVLKRESSTG